jgi:hypothetical protein
MGWFSKRIAWTFGLALWVLSTAPGLAAPVPVAPRAADAADNTLLFEVVLDDQVLADGLTAYRAGKEIYLPLGELSRLLSLAIQVNLEQRRADGYILRETREFHLDLAHANVAVRDKTEVLDPALVLQKEDDLYVSSRLYEQWFPVRLEANLSTLTLTVRAREVLPLQATLARRNRRVTAVVPGDRPDPGYDREALPHRLSSLPFIDQSLSVSGKSGKDVRQVDGGYSAYLTGDLLGMDAEAYLRTGTRIPFERRLLLGRSDPNGELLGPLHATSLQFGSIVMPSVGPLGKAGSGGYGASVTNRPLTQPVRFGRHTIQGDLPPGWDVELFYNEALIGMQQSRPDGRYVFEDLPLAYGPNEFRVVLHGPLGQTKVERQSFMLANSQIAPGTVYYDFSQYRNDKGDPITVAQAEAGLTDNITGTAGYMRQMGRRHIQDYALAGINSYWRNFIVSGDVTRDRDGGMLAQAELRTRVMGVAVSARHSEIRDLDIALPTTEDDPVRKRDALRLDTIVPLPGLGGLPMAFQFSNEQRQSGSRALDVLGRVGAYLYGTSLSNTMHWLSIGGASQADGALQVSRRLAGFGLGGELAYGLRPKLQIDSVSVSASADLARGYQFNLGASRSLHSNAFQINGALNKSLGSYAMGVNASYSSERMFSAGVQLFMATGYEPRQQRVLVESQSLAAMGAASVRVFLDKNLNGVMDGDDEPIKGVGFLVNGMNVPGTTDGAGVAHLNRLPVSQNVDIALNNGTLEDPQWSARKAGVRIVPRRGKVAEIDFPVHISGEIDGTTYMVVSGRKRAVGDLLIELVDAKGKVVNSTRGAADGYYVMTGVFPGTYQLRLSAEQLARLKLPDPGPQTVKMQLDGAFLNGREFVVGGPPQPGDHELRELRVVREASQPGAVDFAIPVRGEIDGTLYLQVGGRQRLLANVRVELIDGAQRVVATAVSAADGYYVMPGIAPGAYVLRLSPEQLRTLKLPDPGAQKITMTAGGAYLNGREFTVTPARTGGQIDFSIAVAGEIDGTTYVRTAEGRRTIADLQVELVEADGLVLASTRSDRDGYFVLVGVAPGEHRLRLVPAQLASLGLADPGPQAVTMNAAGAYMGGKEFVLAGRAPAARQGEAPARGAEGGPAVTTATTSAATTATTLATATATTAAATTATTSATGMAMPAAPVAMRNRALLPEPSPAPVPALVPAQTSLPARAPGAAQVPASTPAAAPASTTPSASAPGPSNRPSAAVPARKDVTAAQAPIPTARAAAPQGPSAFAASTEPARSKESPQPSAGEIDGAVRYAEGEGTRGLPGLQVELLDAVQTVVARTRSGANGYFTLPDVPPGDYWLRLAPAQLRQLQLADPGPQALTVPAGGAYLNGRDFVVGAR